MKLKNVSFLESHFEKLIFGAALVVLLLVVWMYLLGAPNNVNIGGQAVEPGRIDEVIAAKAKTLAESASEPKAKEDLLTWKGKDLVVEIQDRTVARVSGVRADPEAGVARYDLPASTVAFLGGGVATTDTSDPYYEPKLPDPIIYSWDSALASIASEDVAFNEQLGGMFPEEALEAEAFDIPYVSVVAKWDTATILEELEGGDEGDGIKKLPQRYKSFAIVDVLLQRQSSRPDGTWSEEGDPDFEKYTELLPYNPQPILKAQGGQEEFYWDPRSVLSEIDPAQVPAEVLPVNEEGNPVELGDDEKINIYGYAVISAVLNGNDLQIVKPNFPQMINGEWEEPLSPEEKAGIQKDKDRVKEIERIHADVQKRIDSMSRKIAEIEQRGQGAGIGVGGPGAGGLNPAGGGGRPRPQRPRPAAPAGGNRQTQQFKDNIAKSQKEFEPLAQEYQELTGKPLTLQTGGFTGGLGGAGFGAPGGFGDPLAGPGAAGQAGRRGNFNPGFGGPGLGGQGFGGANFGGAQFGGGNFGREIAPLAQQLGIQSGILSQQEIEIYAHDLTAQPGKTYRYRIALRYTNPLFGLPEMNEAQKKLHQRKFLITSAWTAWTDPIDVARLRHYFVQQVTPKPAPGKASLEVWRFFKGQWKKELFKDVKPGHPVGHNLWVEVDDPNLGRKKEEKVDFFSGAYLMELSELTAPRGTRGSRNDALAVFVENGDEIVERLQSKDKESFIREQLEQERIRLEEEFGGVAARR